MDRDTYRLLFRAHARAVQAAYPDHPPLLDREARHRMLAVLDRDPAIQAPHREAAFEEAYGAPFGRVSPVFRRLPTHPLATGVYVRLTHALLADAKLVRALTHFPLLGPRRLAIVHALPNELVRVGFVSLVPNVREARDLALLFEGLEELDRSRGEVAQALLRCRTKEEVRERLRKLFVPRSLCPPPWPGDDRLQPVIDVADVKRLGVEFKNCMRSVADDWALDRNTVVYRYTGVSSGVCAIERDDPFGWYVSDMRGVANKQLSRSVRCDIRDRFAAAGIRSGSGLRQVVLNWG